LIAKLLALSSPVLPVDIRMVVPSDSHVNTELAE
jgi:hypothetical protein